MSSFSPSTVSSATRRIAAGSTRSPRWVISPLRQRVAHEHGVDGLQIELGGQVHHRQILVVELAVLLGGIAVALHQMIEQVAMRLDVALEVHGS